MIFQSAIDFLSDYKPVYDIIFMETSLPMISGITAAREVRKSDKNVNIIFVSDTDKHAIDGYGVNAIGYLVRPIDVVRLAESVRSAMRTIDEFNKKSITIRIKNGIRKVFTDDIYYVEVRGHSLTYKLVNEEVTAIGTLDAAEKALSASGFFRCGKSYIINPRRVTKYTGDTAECGGLTVNISRQYKKQFKTYFDILNSSGE